MAGHLAISLLKLVFQEKVELIHPGGIPGLQFNIPVVTFNRKQGGVFLRDVGSGKTLLGHRGIVTRGKSRVPRELLLQEANVTQRTIASDKSPNKVDVFLVASIDDANLGSQISDFAIEIRRAAYLVMGDNKADSMSKSGKVLRGQDRF